MAGIARWATGASRNFGGIFGIALSLSSAGCFTTASGVSEVSTLPLTGNSQMVLQTFQPALAVRGINCLLCHANVNSSIITDFGYGDPQFFVGSTPGTDYGESSVLTDSKPMTLPWYGDYYGTWQLATQINGTIVVPQATITDASFLSSIGMPGSSGISLAQLIQTDLGADYYGDAPYSGAGPMTAQVTPESGNPNVVEIDQIYIGAPTAAELFGVAPGLTSGTPGWVTASSGSSISGLEVTAGNGGSYVTNIGTFLNCFGDIVVEGTLVLNNVTVNTDDYGCRLYATGAIFINGQVMFSSLAGTQNLQLSSAEAVLLGFDPTTLATRLGSWYPDAQPLTRAAGTNTQKNAALLAEANVVGASVLHDSTDADACPTQMVTYVGHNGGGSTQTLTQCSINYQRLLVNAPNIQSRYIGQFTGVAIAEIALFAPGELNFAYDQVFNSVPILPILPPILGAPSLGGCTTAGCSVPVLGE